MADLKSFASAINRLWTALDDGLQRGLKKAATAINDAAEDNLRGAKTAPAWSYPVPARTGNLLRSQGMDATETNAAYIFNTATYAAAIHSGRIASWAGRGKHKILYGDARAYLDDAVKAHPPEMVIGKEIGEVIQAWA